MKEKNKKNRAQNIIIHTSGDDDNAERINKLHVEYIKRQLEAGNFTPLKKAEIIDFIMQKI